MTSVDDFLASAARTPDTVAVVHDAGNAQPQHIITYRALADEARRAARALLAHRACEGAPIAHLCDEAPGVVVAFLAIALAGAIAVPLDPGAPAPRLLALLADASCAIVLHQRAWGAALAAKLAGAEAAPRCLALEDAVDCEPAIHPPLPPLSSESRCHSIYTSGSTGRPKAVLVDHGALRAYAKAKVAAHRVTPSSRVLLASAHTWDPCIGDVFSTLGVGATLCTAPRA